MKKGIFCVLVCMLMLLTTVVPISATTNWKRTSQPMTMGNILYVGGLGPNNYSKIQDAIENATDGDTVFVYDDSSPYVENILVDVSITLLGENKSTTIVNGSTNGTGENPLEHCGIWITADTVTVSGFTVEGTNLSGIYVSSNHTTISDTILSDNRYYGIVIGTSNQSGPYGICENNTIVNNLITHNVAGMWISGQNNIIKENVITQNEINLYVMFSMNNHISQNIISESYTGVYISGSYNTLLYRNNISQNDKGVYTMWTSADNILQNNFIGNNESASAAPGLFIQLYYKLKGEIPYPIHRSHWDKNFWDKPRVLPYKSPGILWFFIDWHPAKEPYDLPGMS